MKYSIKNIFVIAALMIGSVSVLAQKVTSKAKPVAKKPTTAAKSTSSKPDLNYVPKNVDIYLGHSNITGGKVAKHEFDSLITQGIIAKDEKGNYYKVNGFNFTYGERSAAEDSIGNTIYVIDYLAEYCKGDTLSRAVMNGLSRRTKGGDTAYFDQIRVVSREGNPIPCKSLKIILSR
ncbi:MAG: hypothetical protein WCG87_05110 [Bacteroidota bacterium]